MIPVSTKTLAQLEEEGKEKKYVTLEMGSKISGYTKDYLERLCRLNKVEYRMWNNGQFVIELDSLLKETHAMLLSFEGITFVDHTELTDPVPQFVANILSPVIAEVKSRGNGLSATTEPAREPTPSFSDIGMSSGVREEAGGETSLPGFTYFGKAVNSRNTLEETIETSAVTSALNSNSTTDPTAIIRPHDEWDKVILGAPTGVQPKAEDRVKPSPADTPSQYRPIVTDVDASTHRDDAPLFPELKKDGFVVSLAEQQIQKTAPKGAAPQTGHPFHVAIDHERSSVKTTRSVVEVVATPPVAPATPLTPPLPEATAVQAVPSAVTPESLAPRSDKVVPVVSADRPTRVRENIEPLAPLPRYVPAPSFPVSMPIPHAPSRAVRSSGSLPILRVMPEISVPGNTLPMRNEEHHLSVYDPHPLTTNPVFNLMVAILLIGSFVFTVGIYYPGSPEVYVAGIGALDTTAPTENEATKEAEDVQYEIEYARPEEIAENPSVLPFSDEVAVAVGDTPETILVQPVFRDKSGTVSQYRLDVTRGLVEQ